MPRPSSLWTLLCLTAATSFSFSPPVQAGTIDKVLPGGGTVLLSLTAAERAGLKPGDEVRIQPPGAVQPLSGRIVEIKGGQAKVAVKARKGTLKAGRDVEVASLDTAPMSVRPGNAAAAEEPRSTSPDAFSTGLYHASVVSPAQLYQVNGLRTDVETGYAGDTLKLKAKGTDAELTMAGPVLGANLAYAERRWGVRFGIEAIHGETEGHFKVKDTDSKTNINESLTNVETHISPEIAVPIGSHFVAGMAYTVVQRHAAGEFYGAAHDYSYAQAQTGVAYIASGVEAGLAYTPELKEEDTAKLSDGATVTASLHEPPKAHLHGRMAIGGGNDVFGVTTLNQNTTLNVDGDSGWKNNAEITVGGDLALNDGALLTGAVLAATPAYDGTNSVTADTMVRYGLLAAYERRLTQTARLGAEASYATGHGSVDGGPNSPDLSAQHDTYKFVVTGTVKL